MTSAVTSDTDVRSNESDDDDYFISDEEDGEGETSPSSSAGDTQGRLSEEDEDIPEGQCPTWLDELYTNVEDEARDALALKKTFDDKRKRRLQEAKKERIAKLRLQSVLYQEEKKRLAKIHAEKAKQKKKRQQASEDWGLKPEDHQDVSLSDQADDFAQGYTDGTGGARGEWSDEEELGFAQDPSRGGGGRKSLGKVIEASAQQKGRGKKSIKYNETGAGGKALHSISTRRLEQIESSIPHFDKGAKSLQVILERITSKTAYIPKVLEAAKWEHAERGEFVYKPKKVVKGKGGEISVDVDVGTNSVPYDPARALINGINKWTQVDEDEIDEAYFDLVDLMKAEELKRLAEKRKTGKGGEDEEEDEDEEEEGEGEEVPLREVPSMQRDAATLVHPLGYKPLPLNLPLQAAVESVETQVNEDDVDTEYAAERGIQLDEADILWPTIGEFNMERVSKRIHDFITGAWELDHKWIFHVHPLQVFTDELRKRIIYEVKFSTPTPQQPVPQATASVYFIFDLSHYATREEYVKVHYVIEGTRFMHSPGNIPFQDKWLWTVISDKMRLQRIVSAEVFGMQAKRKSYAD